MILMFELYAVLDCWTEHELYEHELYEQFDGVKHLNKEPRVQRNFGFYFLFLLRNSCGLIVSVGGKVNMITICWQDRLSPELS